MFCLDEGRGKPEDRERGGWGEGGRKGRGREKERKREKEKVEELRVSKTGQLAERDIGTHCSKVTTPIETRNHCAKGRPPLLCHVRRHHGSARLKGC